MRNQQKIRKENRYSNSSQRPKESIIQNLKNSKPFEPSRYKKLPNLDEHNFLK